MVIPYFIVLNLLKLKKKPHLFKVIDKFVNYSNLYNYTLYSELSLRTSGRVTDNVDIPVSASEAYSSLYELKQQNKY